jgi:hypothetical protein
LEDVGGTRRSAHLFHDCVTAADSCRRDQIIRRQNAEGQGSRKKILVIGVQIDVDWTLRPGPGATRTRGERGSWELPESNCGSVARVVVASHHNQHHLPSSSAGAGANHGCLGTALRDSKGRLKDDQESRRSVAKGRQSRGGCGEVMEPLHRPLFHCSIVFSIGGGRRRRLRLNHVERTTQPPPYSETTLEGWDDERGYNSTASLRF